MNVSDFIEVYDEKLGFSKYYTRDGMLVILITSHPLKFDSGPWSSWVTDKKQRLQMLMDSRIIKFFLENYYFSKEKIDLEPMRAFLETFDIGSNVYIGGVSDLKLAFVEKGNRFRVKLTDGEETVEIWREDEWELA